jgi:hypothetical protein
LSVAASRLQSHNRSSGKSRMFSACFDSSSSMCEKWGTYVTSVC